MPEPYFDASLFTFLKTPFNELLSRSQGLDW